MNNISLPYLSLIKNREGVDIIKKREEKQLPNIEYEKIIKNVDEKGVVQFTQDLVRIKSVFHPEKEGCN